MLGLSKSTVAPSERPRMTNVFTPGVSVSTTKEAEVQTGVSRPGWIRARVSSAPSVVAPVTVKDTYAELPDTVVRAAVTITSTLVDVATDVGTPREKYVEESLATEAEVPAPLVFTAVRVTSDVLSAYRRR